MRDNAECSVFRVGEGAEGMTYVIIDANLARRSLCDNIVVAEAIKPGATASDVLEILKVHS